VRPRIDFGFPGFEPSVCCISSVVGDSAQKRVFVGSKIALELDCVIRQLRKQIEKVFGQKSLFSNDLPKGGSPGRLICLFLHVSRCRFLKPRAAEFRRKLVD
jgi:hypothetical protein